MRLHLKNRLLLVAEAVGDGFDGLRHRADIAVQPVYGALQFRCPGGELGYDDAECFDVVLHDPLRAVPYLRFRGRHRSVHPQLTHIRVLRRSFGNHDVADVGDGDLSDSPHGITSSDHDENHEGRFRLHVGGGDRQGLARLGAARSPRSVDVAVLVVLRPGVGARAGSVHFRAGLVADGGQNGRTYAVLEDVAARGGHDDLERV